jgi:hypothetical protein
MCSSQRCPLDGRGAGVVAYSAGLGKHGCRGCGRREAQACQGCVLGIPFLQHLAHILDEERNHDARADTDEFCVGERQGDRLQRAHFLGLLAAVRQVFEGPPSSYDNVTDRKNKHFDIGQAQVVQGARRRVDLPGLRKVVVCLLRLSSFLPPPPGCSGASCILKAKA